MTAIKELAALPQPLVIRLDRPFDSGIWWCFIGKSDSESTVGPQWLVAHYGHTPEEAAQRCLEQYNLSVIPTKETKF